MRIADAEEKLEARATLASGKLPLYFGALNTFLTQNGETGFYVGSTMTVADIAMWRMLGMYILCFIPSINTQSYNRRPLCSTFTFENLRSPKKNGFIPKKIK